MKAANVVEVGAAHGVGVARTVEARLEPLAAAVEGEAALGIEVVVVAAAAELGLASGAQTTGWGESAADVHAAVGWPRDRDLDLDPGRGQDLGQEVVRHSVAPQAWTAVERAVEAVVAVV